MQPLALLCRFFQFTNNLVNMFMRIIIPTSIVSVLTHHKFKAVDFDIVKNYGVFVVLGVIVGTILQGKKRIFLLLRP